MHFLIQKIVFGIKMSSKIDIKESLECKTYEIVREIGLGYRPRPCSNASWKKFNQEMAQYLQKRAKDAKNSPFLLALHRMWSL